MNRKELQAQYKEKKFKIGVFQIRNITNDKVFIGGNTNLTAIWNRLRFELNFGSHSNTDLQKDWKELGEENFVYEILSEIKQEETDTTDYRTEVKTLTEMFIEERQPFGEQGYNLQKK